MVHPKVISFRVCVDSNHLATKAWKILLLLKPTIVTTGQSADPKSPSASIVTSCVLVLE
jgi:hypothetical protein